MTNIDSTNLDHLHVYYYKAWKRLRLQYFYDSISLTFEAWGHGFVKNIFILCKKKHKSEAQVSILKTSPQKYENYDGALFFMVNGCTMRNSSLKCWSAN